MLDCENKTKILPIKGRENTNGSVVAMRPRSCTCPRMRDPWPYLANVSPMP